MIRKIGILILIGIISMYTVIPMALADNNDDVYENPGCPTCTIEEVEPACEDGVIFLLNATIDPGDYPSYDLSSYDLLWSDNTAAGGTFSDPTAEDPTWTPPAGFTGTATLKLEVTEGCTTECDVDVTVYENPGCSITVEPLTCEDGVVFTLDATVTGGTPGTGYTYSWDDGGIGGTFDPSDSSVEDPTWIPPIGFTGAATLKLEVTDDKGCTTECDVDLYDEIEIKDEENIFTIIWDKLTSMLSFFKNGEETPIDVAGEHPSGKVNHGAIVSSIAKMIKSVVGKTHGMIMRTIAKTNWGKKIKENDSLDSDVDIIGKKGKPEKGKKPNKGKKPDVIPPKKGF